MTRRGTPQAVLFHRPNGDTITRLYVPIEDENGNWIRWDDPTQTERDWANTMLSEGDYPR